MENTKQKFTNQIITLALLILCFISLLAILSVLYQNNQAQNNQGRYRFFKNENSTGFYIFDTKSGQVWYRVIGEGGEDKRVLGCIIDYGTPENPTAWLDTHELITTKDLWDEARKKVSGMNRKGWKPKSFVPEPSDEHVVDEAKPEWEKDPIGLSDISE